MTFPCHEKGKEGRATLVMFMKYRFRGTKHLNSVFVTYKNITSDKHCRPLHHVTEGSMSAITVIKY
jgi:hypothetical protein